MILQKNISYFYKRDALRQNQENDIDNFQLLLKRLANLSVVANFFGCVQLALEFGTQTRPESTSHGQTQKSQETNPERNKCVASAHQFPF
jgi:hypothetical protein